MKNRIPIPHEHGAWGMLYIPFLSATFCAGVFDLKLLLAFLVITVAFFLQQPLLTAIRLYPGRGSNPERFQFLLRWSAVYAVLLAGLFGILYWLLRDQRIFIFAAIGAGVFFAHLQLKTERLDRKIVGEAVSVLGLTLSAPFTWLVVTGKLDPFAFLLWGLNIVYFVSSLFYVRLRVTRAIKKRNPAVAAKQCAVYHLAVLLLLSAAVSFEFLSVVVLLAFLPILLRAGWAVFSADSSLNLQRIGWMEVGLSLIFVALLSFGLHP